VENAPFAVLVNRDDRVALANQACLTLFGAECAEDLLGKPVHELFAYDSQPIVAEHARFMREKGCPVPMIEERIIRLDRTLVDVEVSASPFTDQGQPAIHIVIRDVTERRVAEMTIEERERRLGELLEERERNLELLSRTLASTIDVVSQVVEMRDPYTAGHERRVSDLATRIAEKMGMDAAAVDEIRVAGLLHDVGKVSIPAEILSKPGILSRPEFELIKGHAEAGYRIIQSANMHGSTADLVYEHHERCDGSGYPRGLTEDQLLIGSKVLMVADVVEAMISHRPYRAGLSVDCALSEIRKGAGTLYDPAVCDACVSIFEIDGFAFSQV
jgi:PAS domain S-box-containing protein/putative nucleotidyltransferase with HDIG domain